MPRDCSKRALASSVRCWRTMAATRSGRNGRTLMIPAPPSAESTARSACSSDHSEIARGVILTPASVLPASTWRPSGTVNTVTPSTAFTAASALTSTATIPRQAATRRACDSTGGRANVPGPATAAAMRIAAASSPTSPSSSQRTCSSSESASRKCGSSDAESTVPLRSTGCSFRSRTSRQRTAPTHRDEGPSTAEPGRTSSLTRQALLEQRTAIPRCGHAARPRSRRGWRWRSPRAWPRRG